MIDAWFNNENTDWMVGTDDARDIWCTLIEYLSSRTHEQRRADEGDPIKNWYLDIWNIVDKGETTPPPDFDTIVDIIYSDVFDRNITEDTFASIFNIAPVPLQYCFIDFISSDNQQHPHYAGETYGNYDSDYEPEETPGRIFDWSNEEVSAVGGGQGVIDLTGDETKTDSAIDSMPELVSASDTESDLDGYETEATVIVDNDNCEEVDRFELLTNVWHEIEFPWQNSTTPREYFETIHGYAYHSDNESDFDSDSDSDVETDSDSDVETDSDSDVETDSDSENDQDISNGLATRVGQRRGVMRPRSIRI